MAPAPNEAPQHGLRRVLAIDYGRKRIGVALSDELGITAQPLLALERTNRRNDLRRLRELVRTNGVGRIIVGHPVRLDGKAGEMAKEAARFAARLQKEVQIPVELVDERLSSWEASESNASKSKRKQRKANLDAIAAAVILRDFLEREHVPTQAKK